MIMMNLYMNKQTKKEAVSRLPISVYHLNRVIFILFIAALTGLLLLRAAVPSPGVMSPYIILGISLFLYGMSAVSTILFLFHIQRKYWSGPVVSFLCAAMFYLLLGTLCLHCFKGGDAASPQQVTVFWQTAAFRYLRATRIPVAAGCLLMAVSNIVLFRITGFRPVNLLGLLAAVLSLLSRILFLWAASPGCRGLLDSLFLYFGAGTSFCISYLELFFLSWLLCDLMLLYRQAEPPVDYIIIPGCRVWPDGTMSLSLKNRVSRALGFGKEQFRQTGQHTFFLPSGGKGSDAPLSEAAAMKKYLMEHGIPEDHILTEDRSTSTYENLLFSRALLAEREILPAEMTGKKQEDPISGGAQKPRIIISTADYHTLRCLILAQELNIPAEGISCRSHWYIYANACFREYLALLYHNRTQHILLLALIWISFSLLSFLA